MTELSGRIAVVTGGGRGLGRAFSLALAEAGAIVAVADVDEGNAAAVAAEIAELGRTAQSFAVDVADEPSVAALAAHVGEELGTATILINNAALFAGLDLKPLADISVDEWDRLMTVNARGAFLCSRAFALAMTGQGYGKIVNVSSSQFWLARPGYPHYVASKGAIIGLTRALASELGPSGIRVNAVAPGATVTEIPRSGMTEDTQREIAARTPLGRTGTPEDIVGPVLFLASPASDFVTGQTLLADGGVNYD